MIGEGESAIDLQSGETVLWEQVIWDEIMPEMSPSIFKLA